MRRGADRSRDQSQWSVGLLLSGLGLFLSFAAFQLAGTSERILVFVLGIAFIGLGIAAHLRIVVARAARGEDITAPGPPVNKARWQRFAERMGLTCSGSARPHVSGTLHGRPIRLDAPRRRRTRLRLRLARGVGGRLRVRPRVEGWHLTTLERRTGDAEFDRRYQVICFDPGLAERALPERVRAWLLALGRAELTVRGRQVTMLVGGVEDDVDRLRALVEAACAIARGVTG